MNRRTALPLLLVAAVFGAGTLAGYSGVLRDREAAGLLSPAPTTDVAKLLAAADTFEAALADDGVGFRALQLPFIEGVPAGDAGAGALMEGAIDATGGYLEMFIVLQPATATFDRPGLLDPFRRELHLLGDDGESRLRRASARVVDPANPASVEAARFTDVTTPVGMGIDLYSARSIPRLLRTLAVARDEATADGGHLYAGTAPVASYPGAVASDLVGQTRTPLIVLVRLDAEGRLVELGLRAVNTATPAIEYVTVITFGVPTAAPAWLKEARP